MGALLLGQGVTASAAETKAGGQYTFYAYYQADTVFTPPTDGMYRIICVGGSGNGGEGGNGGIGNFHTEESGGNGAGGAGGGSGAVAVSDLTLNKSQSISITLTDGVAKFGDYLYAENGPDGGDGEKGHVTKTVYRDGAPGEPGAKIAKAYGGNVLNASGWDGGRGGGQLSDASKVGAEEGNNGGGKISATDFREGHKGGGGARYPDVEPIRDYLRPASEFVPDGFCGGAGSGPPAIDNRQPNGGSGKAYLSWRDDGFSKPILTGGGGGGAGGFGSSWRSEGTSSSRNGYGGGGGIGQPAIVIIEKALDSTPPSINNVSVSTSWGKTATATISATDDITGVAGYAVTTTNSAPGSWQPSSSFTLSSNGTYYAWAKDAAGNVSTGRTFSVTTVDTTAPSVSGVTVPNEWSKTSATVTVAGTDSQSGISSFAVTTTNSAPGGGWQSNANFTLSANGTYYAWVKDNVGNVSSGRQFSVSKIDTTAPTVGTVTIPSEWGKTSAVSFTASDAHSGVAQYAVTSSSSAPGSGWQANASFTLSANGTYYAWARDSVGNVSAGKAFSITKVDTTIPVVDAVNLTGEWGKTSEASISASDAQSGVAEYAITTIGSAPTSGWQTEKRFTLTENGGYYAWARDAVGNVSAGKHFEMERVDTEMPLIDTVTFSPDSKLVMIELSDVGSGVQGVYINDELKRGKKITYAVPEDVLKLKLQAVDNVGNLGVVRLETVPDVIPPTIDNVYFAADGSIATVTASDKGSSGLRGVHINGEFFDGGSIIYRVPAGTKYVDLQAEDNAGNKSPMLKKRIPGWSEVLGEITMLPVKFSADNTKATLTAKTTKPYSKIDGFYVNGVLISGSPATYTIPKGVKYLEIQAVDSDGDRSAVLTARIPGWSETVTTLEITNVEFAGGKVLAWAKSTNEAAPVKGITVNDSFVAGNPIGSTLAKDARFVTLQAVDAEGDKSEPVVKRVPGWSDVLDTIAVTGVEFSSDGGTVTARADTTKEGATISGIYVGGKLYEGNPVTCSVPTGAKTLTFQAQDSAGDLSPEITRRVPGWSETIDGITVISVEVSADRSAAVAVAQAKTGAPAVAGIYINDTLISGNPVKYAIPRGTQTLRVQAVNTDGDRSEIVTKEVFSDKENSKKTTISITHPGWSNRKKDVRVKISAKNSGTGIDELTATTDEDDSWVDVLDDGYITLTDNSTVTAVAVSGDGNETKKSRYIEWLDDVAPLVNASISEGKAQIVASDKLSGISALYVNGQAFEAGELDRGSLLYGIPAGVTKLTVQAEDVAGNRSRTVELMVKPEEKLPERPIAPLRVPPTSVVKTSATDDNSEEQAATDLSDDEARRAELLRLLEEKRKGRVELTADSTVDLTTLEDTDLPLGSMEVEEYTMKEPRIAVLIACALAFWALVVIVILLILHKRKNDSAYDDSAYDYIAYEEE